MIFQLHNNALLKDIKNKVSILLNIRCHLVETLVEINTVHKYSTQLLQELLKNKQLK